MRSLFFLFLLLFPYVIYAQDDLKTDTLKRKKSLQKVSNGHQAPKVTLPIPQTQIFEKYINHPVNEYNGMAQIEIPLGEIKLNGINIPIVLSYHASGIKCKQFDGEVGAGWSINVGGYRISRTIYGKSDFDYNMYNKQDYKKIIDNSDWLAREKYLGGLSQYEHKGNDIGSLLSGADFMLDSQYDIFTYNAPLQQGAILS